MKARQWGILLLPGVILVYSVVRGVQGSGPLRATAAGMVIVIGSLVGHALKGRARQKPPPEGPAS